MSERSERISQLSERSERISQLSASVPHAGPQRSEDPA
jgi:hypothetical protein